MISKLLTYQRFCTQNLGTTPFLTKIEGHRKSQNSNQKQQNQFIENKNQQFGKININSSKNKNIHKDAKFLSNNGITYKNQNENLEQELLVIDINQNQNFIEPQKEQLQNIIDFSDNQFGRKLKSQHLLYQGLKYLLQLDKELFNEDMIPNFSSILQRINANYIKKQPKNEKKYIQEQLEHMIYDVIDYKILANFPNYYANILINFQKIQGNQNAEISNKDLAMLISVAGQDNDIQTLQEIFQLAQQIQNEKLVQKYQPRDLTAIIWGFSKLENIYFKSSMFQLHVKNVKNQISLFQNPRDIVQVLYCLKAYIDKQQNHDNKNQKQGILFMNKGCMNMDDIQYIQKFLINKYLQYQLNDLNNIKANNVDDNNQNTTINSVHSKEVLKTVLKEAQKLVEGEKVTQLP
ncbi:hypothetical protein PPERSA_07099 [Pseudocohnilembus persalinus]|uniref:Uncharacterized protein n=1 Tax=Pseudocohnilembus persalinus TaxID=266149 RepID=A0A0V0QYH2_PSEPJ|nr:hypothetical protein PPERSA_07099 [Pseudocohnilembus persalinus]|eukprot:KRX06936.1 hypothetical protein PPERSA_07099 [Pseudocohnilembus persalinus]